MGRWYVSSLNKRALRPEVEERELDLVAFLCSVGTRIWTYWSFSMTVWVDTLTFVGYLTDLLTFCPSRIFTDGVTKGFNASSYLLGDVELIWFIGRTSFSLLLAFEYTSLNIPFSNFDLSILYMKT